MAEHRKEIFNLIYYCDDVLNPKRWLAEESSDLSTQIPQIENVDLTSIYLLLKLASG